MSSISRVVCRGLLVSLFAVLPWAHASYVHRINQWRAARVAKLTAPNGWLSLVALDWLHKGINRIGSAGNNDIVFKRVPAHLGSVTWAPDGTLHLKLAPHRHVSVDGKKVTSAMLVDDTQVKKGIMPTKVSFGNISFYVIDRDGRKALRVKDTQAPARKHFAGLDYFPVRASWRIKAQWIPFNPPHQVKMTNVIGNVNTVKIPGKAVFRRNGRRFTLLPIQEEKGGDLFFVLADRTSGKETYGASRFLDVELPAGGIHKKGEVVLDFNKAYNPPCAFTHFATCPLPLVQNRLDLAITAGEKKYHSEH